MVRSFDEGGLVLESVFPLMYAICLFASAGGEGVLHRNRRWRRGSAVVAAGSAVTIARKIYPKNEKEKKTHGSKAS